MAKSWVEKRDNGKVPRVVILEKTFAGIPKGSKLLISSPQEIDAFIRKIPKGEVRTPADMRNALAENHNADATCPVSSGIFLRIVVQAALEERAKGQKSAEITPFWRIMLEGTAAAKKLTIDLEEVQLLRDMERVS